MDCHVYVRCAARDGTRANDARDPIRSGLRRGSMLHASAELSVPRPAVTRVYKLKGISGNDERAKIAARGRSGPLARGPPRRRCPGPGTNRRKHDRQRTLKHSPFGTPSTLCCADRVPAMYEPSAFAGFAAHLGLHATCKSPPR